VGLWLAIVVVLAAIASSLPALKATELPVHEVLAYE
jgi:ABC-type lipoprotein release transport system permease subunit